MEHKRVWDAVYTSGTSNGVGHAVHTFVEDRAMLFKEYLLFSNALNLNENDILFSTFPLANNPHLSESRLLLMAVTSGCSVGMSPCGSFFAPDEGSSQFLLKRISKMNPTILFGTPIYLIKLFCIMKDKGIKLNRLKLILAGGDLLTSSRRDKLTRLSKFVSSNIITIKDLYCSSQMQVPMVECKAGQGVHTVGNSLHLEVFKPDENTYCEEGYGELILSHNFSVTNSLKRYHTGDYVNLRYGECPNCSKISYQFLPLPNGASCSRTPNLLKIKGTTISIPSLEQWLTDKLDDSSYNIIIYKTKEGDDRVKIQIDEKYNNIINLQKLESNLKKLTDIKFDISTTSFERMIKSPTSVIRS